ncbi:MAG: deoxyribodipyrimidine photo-lyase [Candidatus Eremiobacteraeota bacterium]|nr:deoxyribodipyrimidine photo-lyase [Candidatus Eremiobacteraeota bacterium]MBV8355504.1 deoxyribodipyrimidine photo-lyase [Candidatus Eremiobacteraeota bacterium]
MKAILHFTGDLRLEDQAALARASRTGEVVPVVILDPVMSARLRASPRRASLYCSALAALERTVGSRGGKLIVRRGRTGPTLRALARAIGSTEVFWSSSYDAKSLRADRDVQAILEEAGLRVTIVHDAPAVAPEETAGERGGYRAFVPYYERWLREDIVPYDNVDARLVRVEVGSEALPLPNEYASRHPIDPACDPEAVRRRFERYLEGAILQYSVARNVPAEGDTAKIGAELSFGLISARSIVAAVRARRNDPLLLTEERVSLDLFLRGLALRDFFLQLAYFFETVDESPLQEKMRHFTFARTHPALDAWRSGRTGYPLVDAGIRQLRATGWMHPRLRLIAASFLCFDLGVDWRVGRDEWDRLLVEDEPALALGNWQWVAGVGADLAAFPRIYNPRKQARRFDPSGRYVRRWIPELASLPDRALFEPRAAEQRPQMTLPLYGDQTYPSPVVDHESAARAFLERYRREVVRAIRSDASRPSR